MQGNMNQWKIINIISTDIQKNLPRSVSITLLLSTFILVIVCLLWLDKEDCTVSDDCRDSLIFEPKWLLLQSYDIFWEQDRINTIKVFNVCYWSLNCGDCLLWVSVEKVKYISLINFRSIGQIPKNKIWHKVSREYPVVVDRWWCFIVMDVLDPDEAS